MTRYKYKVLELSWMNLKLPQPVAFQLCRTGECVLNVPLFEAIEIKDWTFMLVLSSNITQLTESSIYCHSDALCI